MADPNYTVNDDGTVAPATGPQQVYHVQDNGMVGLNAPMAPQQPQGAPIPYMQPQGPQSTPAIPQQPQPNINPVQRALQGIHSAVNYLGGLSGKVDNWNTPGGVNALREYIGSYETRHELNPYTSINRGGTNGQVGSRASGRYQYVPKTWAGYGGYAEARIAPKAIQDERMGIDLQHRLAKFNGDPFKAIAVHWWPNLADNPQAWEQPIYAKQSGQTVKVNPVAWYVRQVVRGTPLQAQFENYMQQQLHPQMAQNQQAAPYAN